MENSDIEVTKACDMCGYLKKQSPNILKGWQKRYFTLCKSEDSISLAYFLSQEDKKP